MKKITILSTLFLASVSLASETYSLKFTNGGPMPVSPGVVYVRHGQAPAVSIGSAPTPGLIKLCQSGDPTLRLAELKEDKTIRRVLLTGAPVLPGGNLNAEVVVDKAFSESVHFEAMYGKTKDTCSVASINSHSLFALKQHVTTEVLAQESVLATGAFLDPALESEYASPCETAKDAVSCLRELALPSEKAILVRFFAPYLPSVVNFIETKYGAVDTQSLLIPATGTVQLRASLKH